MAFQRPFAAFSATASLYSGVSDFVDDWSIGPWSIRVCLPFYAAHNLIHDLDQALGQQTNRGKSTLTLARQLLEDERSSCLAL